MATYNVTTWSELVNALRQSEPDDIDIRIYLMNDIDMNDVAPTGVSTTQIQSFGRSMILEGNGHCIKNLRTSISSPQPIFSMANYHYLPSKALNIQNLDFVNLILAGSDFLYDSSDYRQVNFTNCRFVGYRTGNSYLINQATKISCTSCYFDMPWYGAGSSAYDYTSIVKRGTPTTDIPTANYCWFHESYGGWIIYSPPYGSTTSSPTIDYPTTQCCMFAMNGCYIDGYMKRPSIINNSDVNALYCEVYRRDIGNYYTATTPNVIDMMWEFVDKPSGSSFTPSSGIVYVLNMSALFAKTVIVPTYQSYTNYYLTPVGSQPNIILATAEQMQDVSWLRAQGFPIIDPTPVED